MTDGAVTTERYRSLKGETILTLENEDLRTETEVLNSGRIITRTWQNGSVTTLTHAENGKSIMVVLDRNGEFGQKIITSKDSTGPWCFEYRKKRPVKLPPEECLGLIPGFD